MPIANCLVRGELPPASALERLVDAWSEASGVGPEHMTINVIPSAAQVGAGYRLMAFLYLPSLWSAEQVRALQTGLATALSQVLSLPPADVHVITSIVASGHVVEAGGTQEWPAG